MDKEKNSAKAKYHVTGKKPQSEKPIQKNFRMETKKLLKQFMKKWWFVGALLVLAVLIIGIISIVRLTGAASPGVWQSTTSTNCLTQADAGTMVEVNGSLYILTGGANTFKRYSASTGICESANLANFPVTASTSTTLERLDNSTIMAINNGNVYIYKINLPSPAGTWIIFDRAKLDDSTPIDQTGATQGVGNSTVVAGSDVFVLAGNGTTFQKYTPSTNTWTSRTALPVSAGSGAALAYSGSGDNIYVLAGNSTNNYRYSISGDSWTALGATPATPGPGGALAIAGTNLYAFGGNNTKNFWVYDTTQSTPGTWTDLTSGTTIPPDFVRGGGAMTALGGDIYAFQGNNTKNFWKYCLSGTGCTSNQWSALAQTRLKVASGGALTNDGTNIYGFRGIGAKNYWKYTVDTNTWSALQDIPLAPGGTAAIDAKGGLAYMSGTSEIYAVTGAGVTGSALVGKGVLWRYPLSGSNQNTWAYYPAAPAVPGGTSPVGSAIIQPGTGSTDSTGDYLYFLKGNTSGNPFFKFSKENNTWIPWDRSKTGTNTAVNQTTPAALTQGSSNSITEAGGEFYMVVTGSNFVKYNATGNKWTQLANLPTAVNGTGQLTKKDNSTLYFFTGVGLWKYDIPTDTWTAGINRGTDDSGMLYSQDGLSQTTSGSIMTELNGKIYAVRGSTTQSFEKFDPATNTWVTLTNVTTGASSGDAITKIGTDIYLLAGNASSNFYKYNTTTNAWSTLATTPGTVTYGGSLAAVGSVIYAFQGNTQNFWAYCALTSGNCSLGSSTLAANTWTPSCATSGCLAVAPATVQGGAAMTIIGTDIYALRGANTGAFWKYDTTQTPGSDSWVTTLAQCPENVQNGGSLTTSGDNKIYATKGSNTNTFLKYDPSSNAWSYQNNVPGLVGNAAATSSSGSIVYSPTLGDIFAVTGLGVSGVSTSGNGLIYRFKLTSGTGQYTWVYAPSIPSAPAGISGGSGIAYPGSGNDLYVLQGAPSAADKGFWVFNTASNEWNVFLKGALSNGNPIKNTIGANEGNGNTILEDSGKFYILLGSGTLFTKYDPTLNTYFNLTPTPGTISPGASMVKIPTDSDSIYILRGTNGTDFWKYSISNNTYTTLTGAPRAPGNGSKLTYPGDGDFIYAAAGDTGTEFWRYSISQNFWIQMNVARFDGSVNSGPNPTPFSQSGASQGSGNSIAEVGGVFYVIGGNNTQTFQKFDPSTNAWTPTSGGGSLSQLPANASFGTSIAVFNSDTLYVLANTTTDTIWKYTISTNTWTSGLANTPAAVGAGGALTYPGSGNYVYALEGGTTLKFWRYCTLSSGSCTGGVTANTWDDAGVADPTGTNIAGGGALVSVGGDIYALIGNNSTNFSKYTVGSNAWSSLHVTPAAVNAGGALTTDGTDIYVTRGGNTGDLWKYTVSSDSFSTLATFPTSYSNGATVLFGASGASDARGGIAYSSTLGEIYAVSGNGITGAGSSSVAPVGVLWRYKMTNDSWPHYIAPTIAPAALSGTNGFVSANNNDIYVMDGNGSTTFRKYTISPSRTSTDPDGGSWTTLHVTPAAAGNGNTMVYDGTYIYATRAKGTADFWKYDIGADTWSSLTSAPVTIGFVGSATGYGTIAYSSSLGEIWAVPTDGISGNTLTGKGVLFRYRIANNDWPTVAAPATTALTPNVGGAGACLTAMDSNTLYAARGRGTTDFWKFDIPSNSWTDLSATTPTPAATASGASCTTDGAGTLYMTRGNATTDFWKFTSAGGWNSGGTPPAVPTAMGDTGTTTSNKGGITYYNNQIWASPGTGATTITESSHGLLYVYDITSNTWPVITDPANNGSATGNFTAGSALAAVNGSDIYALQGSSSTANPNFWRYRLSTNTWASRADMPRITPSGATADVEEGGSLATTDSGTIYGLRGKATSDFFRYTVDPETCDGSGNNPGTGSSPCTGYNVWANIVSQNFPVNVGTAVTTADKGELAYSSSTGKLFGIPGSSTVVYVLDLNHRVTIESVNGGGSVYANTPFTVLVQSTDASGNAVAVAQDTQITLTRTSGTGTLGGTVTGTILSGQSQATISGVTYSTAESGVVLTATDTSSSPVLTATSSSSFTVLVPPPTISSITPNTGATAGGNSITISGSNFVATPTVTFGGTSAASVTFVNSSTLTVGTPAHAAGAVDVVVTNPDTQSDTETNGFTFGAPTVTNVNPNHGSQAGGTGVTITGTNFTGTPTVTFGGTAATGVTLLSSTSLTATTPAHASGAADVVVTNSDAQAGTLTSGFTFDPPPTVTNVSASSGSTTGGTSVTITGTGFLSTPTVTFGGNSATGVVFVNSTTITANTPAHAAGAVNVVVTNPDSQSGTLTDGYTFIAPPTVTDVSPPTGTNLGGTSVTITGTNFQTSGTTTVTFGGTAATGVSVTNSTTLTATTPAHAAGAVDVVVTNPDSQTGTLTGGFTYSSTPTVTNVSASSGTSNGGTGVTITGTNFTSTPTVTFGGSSATGVVFVNSTTLTATTPAHAAGTVDVVVTNPDTQSGTLTNGYTFIAPPTINSITPNYGTVAAGTEITISGTDFTATPTVTFGGTSATGITFVNSTTLTLTAPAHAAGAVDVVVTNPDAQSATSTNGYEYVTGSASNSTFTANPTSVIADGSSLITLTLTLKDSSNRTISGAAVSATRISGVGTSPPTSVVCSDGGSTGITNANGHACFTTSSATVKPGIYRARDNTDSLNITQTASVTFTAGPGDPTNSTFISSPGTINADGTTASTLTVNVQDAYSHNVSNTTVSVTKTSGPGSPNISPASTTTNIDGLATFTVTSTTGGTDTFTAKMDDVGAGTDITQTADVTFLDINDSASTVSSSPPNVAADGTSASLVTVTVKDYVNNPLPGKTVSLSASPGTPTITQMDCSSPSTPDPGALTDTDGKACFAASSGTIELDTFTAMVESVTLTSTATVEFACDVGTQGNSTSTSGEQCALVSITPQSGSLSIVKVPDNFSFPAASPGGDSFNNPTGPDNGDRVIVSDTRTSSSFTLQLQASTSFADTVTPTHIIPLTNLYVGTSTVANGTRVPAGEDNENAIACDGMEYLGPAYDGLSNCSSVPNPINSPFNITGNYDVASTYTGLTNNFLSSPIDIMQATSGHNGSFSQLVNYYVHIPSSQELGDYQVTLTFTAL